MRKTRLKMAIMGLFAAFTLVFLTAGQGQAQTFTHSTTPKVGGASNGTIALPANYVSVAEGVAVLQNQCTAIKNFLITLIPGTQAYKTVETSYAFYGLILSGLLSGNDVPASIQQGMGLFQYPDYLNTPSAQIQSLYEEATVLLTN